MYGKHSFLLSICFIIEFHKVDNIVSQFLCKTLPFLLADLLPDLCWKLQLYRINVPAVPGAVDLSYPAASVVFILPGSRLPESSRVSHMKRKKQRPWRWHRSVARFLKHGSQTSLSEHKLFCRDSCPVEQSLYAGS